MDEDINNYHLDTFMEDPEERFKKSVKKFNSDNGTMITMSDDINEVDDGGQKIY